MSAGERLTIRRLFLANVAVLLCNVLLLFVLGFWYLPQVIAAQYATAERQDSKRVRAAVDQSLEWHRHNRAVLQVLGDALGVGAELPTAPADPPVAN
jgi:hypothetical protein